MKENKFSVDKYPIILLDFDGVIAESTDIKTEAFKTLFEPFGPEILKKVISHHIDHGGISRFKKFQLYYTNYLNRPLSEEELQEVAKKYSSIVVEKVISAPLVKGIDTFLEKYYKNKDLYIVSGTPQEELEIIVSKKNLSKYFKGVYGVPHTKPEIAHMIMKKSGFGGKDLLYIGDSLSDYNNAMDANIEFLGRVMEGETSRFPEETPIISDFFDILK